MNAATQTRVLGALYLRWCRTIERHRLDFDAWLREVAAGRIR